MPESAITPKRRVSQAPIKFIACFGGCGVTVEYRTTPRVYCPPCKVAQRLASARVSMEKQRRKLGIPLIKGTVAPCRRCGVLVQRTRISERYCEGCAVEVSRERARKVSRAKKGVVGAYRAASEWAKKKRHSSPRHAINFRFKAAIRRVLVGGKRGRRWEHLVGYTLADLMRHLERQFLPGMSWANRSRWHIDHVQPLASFKFETAEDPEFRAAWALSNLRPLWAPDNYKKNAHRTHLL